MKKIFLSFGFMAAVILSCSRSGESTDNRIIGPSGDIIQLSQKEATFKPSGDSITITSKGNWWICGLSLDNNIYNLQGVNVLANTFLIERPEFKIEKRNASTIFIKMNKNMSSEPRTLLINLEAGDYFDYIKVTQPTK